MHFRPGRNYLVIIILAFIFFGSFAGMGKDARKFNAEGVRLLRQKKYEDAMDSFTKALVFAPDNKNIKKNLAFTCSAFATRLVLQGDEKHFDRAIDLFRQAAELAPDKKTYRVRLSLVLTKKAKMLYDQRRFEMVLDCAEEVLKHNDKNVDAWILLGDASFYMQRLDEAKKYWAKALSLDPGSEIALERLETLRKRHGLENDFKQLVKEHFIITYEGTLEKRDVYQVESMLNEAYRVVGQDLDLFPESKIVVILYSSAGFEAYEDGPEWVAGLYDGKIRLPVKISVIIGEEYNRYKGVVYHEYTHALLHILVQRKCPLWLEEGLATYEEDRFYKRPVDRLKEALRDNKLIPIQALDGVFYNSRDEYRLNLAYEEAMYLVKYILDRYNWAYVRELLEDFSKGESAKAAIKKILGISFDQFEKNWVKFLKSRLL